MSAEVARLLFDSDRRYFAAGAESMPFAGGTLQWMPGLQHIAAGCIAELEDLRSLPAASAAAAAVGAPLLRFYMPDGIESGPEADGLLAARELACARTPEAPDGALPIDVRPVITASDWEAKAALAAAFDGLPDGKLASAHEWTELKRRKSEAGYARFYIAEIGGEPCGSFALADCRPLLRLKNLTVHPRFRRQGIGRAIVDYALRQGYEGRFAWVGVFALEDGPGRRLYESCGFELVGAQTEWTRPAVVPAALVAPPATLAAP